MHIAFLNPQGNFDHADSYWTEHPDFGGQLVYVKETALALARLGHRVDILTRRIVDPAWPEFAAQEDGYPGSDVRILRLPCGPEGFAPKEKLWPHLAGEWVTQILGFYDRAESRPAFFTAHYGDGGLAGAELYRRTGIPFTFTGHSLGAQKMDKLGVDAGNFDENEQRYRFSVRIAAERLSMSTSRVIVVSTELERREQYGHSLYHGAVDPADDDRFAVIPPGVNRTIFTDEPQPDDGSIAARIEAAVTRDIAPARRELPLVVCSSRLDPKKNHLGVVRAFAGSPGLQTAANLAIVVRGLEDPLRDFETLAGEEREILREIVTLAAGSGLSGALTGFPLDNQAELAAAYRVLAARGSIFCLTALYEPFGLAPLEAMSCGLPAVVTKNGGPRESLADPDGTEYGVLVDPLDPEDIAAGLLDLVADPENRQRFRAIGLARVRSKYTWERTAEGYLAELEAPAPGGPNKDHGGLTRDHGEMAIPAYFFGGSREHLVEALKARYLQQEGADA